MSNELPPILTAHLYAALEARLLELLRSLQADEWKLPTIAGDWNVKDVAAHLLDTQLRKLSIVRDGYVTELPQIASAADLAVFVNRLNHAGVALYRRLSPPVLIDLMEVASRQSSAFHAALDPFAPATFAVSWAGESESLNWFDTARELTERWHHQQQIRLATHRPGILTREFYHPVLDTFMRALPFHYRNVAAQPGTLLQFIIAGDCGGMWHLVRDPEQWRLIVTPVTEPAATLTIPQDIAWRIFTKGIDRASAKAQVVYTGKDELALHALSMLSIVA
jgi:uncharacterized protein (TIGR03083 family)